MPPVDVIHLHHGVWLNASRPDSTFPSSPSASSPRARRRRPPSSRPGYGYEFHAKDRWVLNYMLHNLTSDRREDLAHLRPRLPARVGARGREHRRGATRVARRAERQRVPGLRRDQGERAPTARSPIPIRPPIRTTVVRAKNVWKVDTDGVLVGTGGHLHPGGLHDDLWLDRSGQTAHLFRSDAKYFEPAGAVSWDVAMTVTNPDWNVAVHRATPCASRPPTTPAAPRGTSRWGSWSCGWPISRRRRRSVRRRRSTSPAMSPTGIFPRTTTTAARTRPCPTSPGLPTRSRHRADPHRDRSSTGQGDMRTGGNLPQREAGPAPHVHQRRLAGRARHLALDHRVQGAVQPRDRHRLPARRRRHPVRLGPARHPGHPDRPATSTGRHRPTSPPARTPTSAGSTRSCAVASS